MNNERGLKHYEMILGKEIWNSLEKYIEKKLESKETISILDVGCGQGTFLNDLDIIISVATLYLVKDKQKALNNISQSLKKDGIGLVSIEPFYFGPKGFSMFENCEICSWNKDLTCLLLKGSENPQILKGWYAHALPNELLKYVMTKFMCESNEIPVVVFNKEQGWKSSANAENTDRFDTVLYNKECQGPFINWDLFPFLKVKFINTFKPSKGYTGPGKAYNLIELIKNNSDDCKPEYTFFDYCNIL